MPLAQHYPHSLNALPAECSTTPYSTLCSTRRAAAAAAPRMRVAGAGPPRRANPRCGPFVPSHPEQLRLTLQCSFNWPVAAVPVRSPRVVVILIGVVFH